MISEITYRSDIDYREPLWWFNEESEQMLNRGYLLRGETVEGAIDRITTAAAEKYRSYPEIFNGLKEAFTEMIMRGWISFSSPVWANMGTQRGLPISCFNVHVPDSMEGITGKLGEVIMQTKIGGGTSGYFGELRSRGVAVSNNGKSSGSVSFLKLFDTAMDVVSQGGVRRGAFAAYTDIDHGDVEEFLQIKDIGNPIQNLFFGVCVPDYWMDHMVNGDPKDPEVMEKRNLWAKVLQSRQEKGLPYIFFTDNVNRNKPDIYRELQLPIRASNLCFTGDTMVAVADGRNAVSIKELAQESNGTIKFPVYSGKEVGIDIRGNRGGGARETDAWNPEIKNAIAFKSGTKKVITITLSNGDTFRCTEDHELALRDGGYIKAKDSLNKELAGFFTYTNIDRASPYRHINTLSNAYWKQHIMMYKFANGENYNGVIDHINNDFSPRDHISNLQCLSHADHRIKTSKEIEGTNNWVYRVKDKEAYWKNKSRAATGKNNSRFSGIDNFKLIEIGKEIFNIYGDFNNAIYQKFRREYNRFDIPSYFSNYRFGGNFGEFIKYVRGEKEYDGSYDITPEYTKHKTAELDEQKRIYENTYNTFFNHDGYTLRRKGLVVTNIEDLGEVEDVYDLTVEDNHNFYIITSTDDEDYLNCKGILVHNCSEILLPSNEHESFICCLSSMNLELYEEWKDTNAVKLAIYFLDAVLSEFIDKTEDKFYLKQSRDFAIRHRAVGLGVLGWHSLLQSKMIPFESFEASMLNARIFKDLQDKSDEASIELGEILGVAPIYDELIPTVTVTRRRNTTTLAIAPTTSSSSILGQVSAGIEPYASNYYKAGLAKGNFMRKNKYLDKLLTEKGLNTEETWRSIMLTGGSVQQLDGLTEDEKSVFKTFKEISPMEIISQAAQRQQYIDQSQSLNLSIPAEMPIKDVNHLMVEAWKKGIKTLYYQRSASVSKELVQNFVNCSSCEA